MSTNNRSTWQQRAASSKRSLAALRPSLWSGRLEFAQQTPKRPRSGLSSKLVAVLAFISVVAAVRAGPPVWCPPPVPKPAKVYGPGSSQALVLELDRSLLMKFQKMKWVAVVDPEIADVTVASLNELLVRAVGLGETMLYVWDARGLNKFSVSVVGKTVAQKRVEDLERSLSPSLSVRAFSDTTVVVEGEVKDEAALRNLSALLQAASDEQVQVVNMVTVEGLGRAASPAALAGQALSELLDDRLKVTAWGATSLLIEGELDDQQELLRARQLISAFSEGLHVVDMITVKGEPLPGQVPVAQIQELLGEGCRVEQLRANLVVVQGQVESQQELERVNRLLEAFSDQMQTINLVQVVPPKPDLATVRETLQAALGEEITVKLVGEEALMLEGALPSEERKEQAASVLKLFEGRVPIVNLLTVVEPDKRQVLVAVKVLDINRGATEALGIDWGQYGGTEGTAVFRPQPFLFGHIYGPGGWHRLYDFAHQVHALIQNQKARVLSEPNLLVNDGEEATILIGGEIPIPVAQTAIGGAASVTIEWKPYGVNLKIKPTISHDSEKVLLEVEPEVSSLDYGNAVTIGGLVLPAMRTRRAQTTITLPDNGILAIGGLIQSDQSKAVDKIPILGDLPIIGQLFRHDTFIQNKSELIILVMPQILDEEGKPLHPIPIPEGVSEDEVFTFGE